MVWSTHNGGATWAQDHLPAGLNTTGTVFDLEAAAGRVYLMAHDKSFGVTVESSPLTHDSWSHDNAVGLGSPAGGGEQSGAFVLQGTHGWLVEGNDRGPPGAPSSSAANGLAGYRRVPQSATVLPSRQPPRPKTSSRYA